MSDSAHPTSDDDDLQPLAAFNELQSNITAMRAELAELENAIIHLLQTNRELREDHAADAELAAVGVENEEIVVRKTARVQRLKLELAQLDATYAASTPVAPPAPAPPPATADNDAEIHL